MNNTSINNSVLSLIIESFRDKNCRWRKNIKNGPNGALTIDLVNSDPRRAIESHLWNRNTTAFGTTTGQLVVALARLHDTGDERNYWVPYYIGHITENAGTKNGVGYSVAVDHKYDNILGKVAFYHVNKAPAAGLCPKFSTLEKNIDFESFIILENGCINEDSLKVLTQDYNL